MPDPLTSIATGASSHYRTKCVGEFLLASTGISYYIALWDLVGWHFCFLAGLGVAFVSPHLRTRR